MKGRITDSSLPGTQTGQPGHATDKQQGLILGGCGPVTLTVPGLSQKLWLVVILRSVHNIRSIETVHVGLFRLGERGHPGPLHTEYNK